MEDPLPVLRSLADTVEDALAATPLTEWGGEGGMGASGRPAKRIDRVAEQAVIEALDAYEVPLNLCSEEVGTVDRGYEKTLVLDPVDGTMNAVRGIPFYCVSLAIATTGLSDVEAGLVRNLPTGTTYEATRGGGARREGEAIRVSELEPNQGVRSPVPSEQRSAPIQPIAEEVPNIRGLGAAALELALVAQGALDVYLHLKGGLRIVDIAAGVLLVREAGGTVVTPEGGVPELPLDVTHRTNLVAAGDPRILRHVGVPA